MQNPVIGGNPAKFIINSGRYMFFIKIGAVDTLYNVKKTKDLQIGADITHLMCIILVKNNSKRSLLLPTQQQVATNKLMATTLESRNFGVEINKRNIGANFCHVRKMNAR